MKKILCFFIFLMFVGCGKEKLIYKRIETKSYFIEGYTYSNGTDAVFPNELVVINKITKDTVYKCQNCYKDFNVMLEDSLLIYGDNQKDSVIDYTLKLKQIPVPYDYKYNIPWKER